MKVHGGSCPVLCSVVSFATVDLFQQQKNVKANKALESHISVLEIM
jgi:hypothetical protein